MGPPLPKRHVGRSVCSGAGHEHSTAALSHRSSPAANIPMAAGLTSAESGTGSTWLPPTYPPPHRHVCTYRSGSGPPLATAMAVASAVHWPLAAPLRPLGQYAVVPNQLIPAALTPRPPD